MTDEHFERLLHDAARTYHAPPEPDIDAMWQAIESEISVRSHTHLAVHSTSLKHAWARSSSVRIAAALVVGVVLGRASMVVGRHGTQPATSATPAPALAQMPAARTDIAMARPYEIETSRYLGQTAALLISLPTDVAADHADEQVTARAEDLLTRTRLLLDSPAADDPDLRSLFEDLELVLAQVVRLHDRSNRLELDLIHRALEQRDVLPRLRTAAADISAN
jgi:hypothetical protein